MIEMYTRPGCSYCTKAKTILHNLKLEYNEIVIGTHVNREQVIERFPNNKQLPIIVVNGAALSGMTEFESMINEYRQDFGKTLLTE